jgi:hypothetical protein
MGLGVITIGMSLLTQYGYMLTKSVKVPSTGVSSVAFTSQPYTYHTSFHFLLNIILVPPLSYLYLPPRKIPSFP